MAASKDNAGMLRGSPEQYNYSREYLALMQFAAGLQSWNDSTETGGISEEGDTRQEATLLMSLLASPARFSPDDDMEVSSSSASEQSYFSDSSHSRRGTFRFICPSLSLESTRGAHSTVNNKGGRSARSSKQRSVALGKHSAECSTDVPSAASLLGRPLKVDDRDALRLSADAMARNVHQSFQKAVEWRIQTWISSLSKVLVLKEREMLRNGATTDDLKALLETSEAMLINKLRWVSHRITVSGAGIGFRVLPDRVKNDEESDDEREENEEPESKRARTEPGDFEESEYDYSVCHAVLFDCTVNLHTPAGHSEVTMQVPGAMHGTFLSAESGSDTEELASVVIKLDTSILAAMVEKGCRTIVRSSLEYEQTSDEVEANDEKSSETEDTIDSSTSSTNSRTATAEYGASSPTPECTDSSMAIAATGAMVTPYAVCSEDDSNNEPLNERKPKASVLLPIPDDLDKRQANLGKRTVIRRISPQPNQDFGGADFTPQTPKRSGVSKAGLPLISPPPVESQDFHEMVATGPSLPMLVEAACLAMKGD